MKPYYDDGNGIVIYCGDCREVLPSLGMFDLLLTDPPYGIAHLWKGGVGRGWSKADTQKAKRNSWDETTPDAETIRLALEKSRDAVIWGGNYFPLPVSRGWLVWNKPERNFTLAEAELAWTTRDAVIRVRDLPRSDVGRVHPTQKPLALMTWCLSLFPDVRAILDPWMGSGTTLRAAKDAGLQAVGIEIDQSWCDTAIKRLAQGVLAFGD